MTHRRIDGADLDDDEPTERRPERRRRSDQSLAAEIAKILIPILLAWGIAYVTAQNTVATEVAVVKERENAHFEEIQRTLTRIDQWITRQGKP